jgi:hypothetical protein
MLRGDVAGFAAVVELSFLEGVENIRRAHPGIEVHALVRY